MNALEIIEEIIAALVASGLTNDQASTVVSAIVRRKIPHITISL